MIKKNLEPGEYYLYSPKLSSGLATLFQFGRSADKTTQERVESIVRNSSKSNDKTIDHSDSNGLAVGSWNSSPSTYRLGNGSVLVCQFGVFETVGDLHRVQPSVYHDSEKSAVCIFQGYLSNLDELRDRYSDAIEGQPDSPTAVLTGGRDPSEIAAKTIFCMYLRASTEPLVLLSELQGQYSFILYDGDKRQVFLARDSSGAEPLYYEVEDNGGISVSNAQIDVPADVGTVQWSPIPPGHFIAGRQFKLQQFALTPKQLHFREYLETIDDDLSPRAAVEGNGGSSGKRSLIDELAEVSIE